MKFPFLDASTLSQRKRFCELELVLNRRLAPATYLGIVPITESQGQLALGGRGKIVEWVVKMHRLPDERMLDRLVARRQVTRGQIQAVGDVLTDFFRVAGRSRSIDRHGTPEQVSALTLGNLEECRLFLGRLFSESDRTLLESAYRQYLALYQPVLLRRVKERRIIDGHGDLRCENICLTNPPNVFDCVEFQPAFRCGDAVNDFSFLVMDLEFRGRDDLARLLVKTYRHNMQDPTFESVLPFYKCHRSLVWGKVRGFAWLQHPRTASGKAIRTLSKKHFRLAVRYAKQFAPPRLVVIGGLIGTGKSTLARSLAQSLGATWLRTDEIRLSAFAHLRRRGQGFAEGLYAPRVSALVYQRLTQRAQALLRQGHSVICDGTFSQAAGREMLRQIARQQGASFHLFECTVPRATALRRIAARYAKGTDLSEARPEHYEQLRAGFEPIHGWPASDWTRLSDNRPSSETFQAALASLRQAWAVVAPPSHRHS